LILESPRDPVVRKFAFLKLWSAHGGQLAEPWRALIAFELARLQLSDCDGFEEDDEIPLGLLRVAQELPLLAPWPTLFRAILEAQREHREDAVELLSALSDSAVPGEDGGSQWRADSAVQLARELTWLGIGEEPPVEGVSTLVWADSRRWRVYYSDPYPDGTSLPFPLAQVEFEVLQRRGVADLYFCLPERGTAWLRTRNSVPQPALPQVLRLLIALLKNYGSATAEELREEALGPAVQPSALEKVLSRTRRLLSSLGLEGRLVRSKGTIRLENLTVAALVSVYSQSFHVRLRREKGIQIPDDLLGWAPTVAGEQGADLPPEQGSSLA